MSVFIVANDEVSDEAQRQGEDAVLDVVEDVLGAGLSPNIADAYSGY